MIYLNQADGRKEKQLDNTLIENPESIFVEVKTGLKKLLTITEDESIFLVQNATTALIETLKPILEKDPSYEILLSIHEIKWFETLFKQGRLPTEEVTYPNYAPLEDKDFLIHPYTLFDPLELAQYPERFIKTGTKQIIILSHISRMTGELLIDENFYRKLHEINNDIIVIIDGSQAIGAMQAITQNVSDTYIAVTSKFINAEPHIGILWVDEILRQKFEITPQEIIPEIFAKELYSTKTNLDTLEINQAKLMEIKSYLQEQVRTIGSDLYEPKNQVAHLALIPAKNPEKIVNDLKEKNIFISTNINWGIVEPVIPCVRISLVPQTTEESIDLFITVLKEIDIQ